MCESLEGMIAKAGTFVIPRCMEDRSCRARKGLCDVFRSPMEVKTIASKSVCYSMAGRTLGRPPVSISCSSPENSLDEPALVTLTNCQQPQGA